MQWKSNARYNQPPESGTIFSLKTETPNSRIVIHKIHGCGEGWYLSCPPLAIDAEPLNTEDFNTAVENAKAKVFDALKHLLALYGAFPSDNSENEIVRY